MNLTVEEDKIIHLLKKDKAYFDFFFTRAKSLKWLDILRSEFINIQTIADDQGNFDFWLPLIYLEKVAEQIAANPHGKDKDDYAKEILKIIDEVVDFSIKRQENSETPVNNYHIWWYLTKILHKIPNEIIKVEVDLEKFEKWMGEFANSRLARTQAMSDVSEIIRLWFPQFLNADMRDYADIVIRALVRIEPSKKKTSFIDRHEAKLTFLDRWRGDELAKHPEKIGQFCGEATIWHLLEQLCEALEFRTQEQSRVFKTGDNYCKITLNRVKRDGLPEEEIGFQDGRFAGIAKKYTKEDLEAVKTDDDYMLSREEPTGEKKTFSLSEVKDVESFKEKFKDTFTKGKLKDLSLDKADDFEKKVSYLYEAFFTDHSYIWFSDLDKPKDCLGSNAHDILSILCSKVLLARCEANPESGKVLINRLISEEKYKFSIFGRMVLRVIDKLWEKGYKDFFNKKLIEAYPDLFDGGDYRLELSRLFKNHAKGLGGEIAGELKKRLKKPPRWYQHMREKESDAEGMLKHWQFEWAAFLKEAEDFGLWYEELKKDFPDSPDPVVRQGVRRGVGWVKDNSPKTKDELLEMPVAEVVRFFDEFEGAKDTWELSEGKPSRDGLANEFQMAVKENPDKFVEELSLFNNVSIGYATALIKGLQNAWQAEHVFDWAKVLGFSRKYIQTHKEKEEKSSGHFNYTRSCLNFAEEVSRLMRVGSGSDDRRAFGNDDMFDDVADTFETIFEAFPIKEQREERKDSSAMNFAINTPIGRIIEDFFLFSMHVKRVNDKHIFVQNWGEDKYDRFFDIDEGYIYFGRYLPNMCFLDKEWAHAKVKEINDFGVSTQPWKDFMEGYLSGGSVYKDLYELLRPSYENAIKSKLANDQVDDNLARHITLGYLRDYEDLREDFDGLNPEGLFELMLKDANTDEKKGRWSEIVQFMWSCTGKSQEETTDDKLPPEIKNRIRDFWHWTYEQREFVQNQLGQGEYELFLSRISLLTIILPHVSDSKGKYKTKSWLMESAKHVEKEHYSSFLIEYFLRFNNKEDLKNIAAIYKEILNSGRTPIYKKEDIEALIDRIHGADSQAAEEIVETYARRGQLFLRDLWEKWNQNKV